MRLLVVMCAPLLAVAAETSHERNTMDKITPGIYRHYKGNYYRVLGTARSTGNPHEFLVIYQSLYEGVMEPEGTPLPFGTMWARPLEQFTGSITLNGQSVQRFSFVHAE